MAHIETFIQSAWQHLRADRAKQAMNCAKKAHAISPNSPDVAHLLGLLASRDGKPEIALPLLQKAIDTGGKTPQRLRHIAEALLDAGYPQQALIPLQDALNEFGESTDVYGLKSAIEIALEQWDAAAQSAQKAISLNPSLMAWELNLSFAQMMQAKVENGFKNATARPINLTIGSVCPVLQFTQPCTIWLKSEQGLGDTLFYLRYVAPLVERGWQFHLEADKKLIPILQSTKLFLSIKEKNNCPKNEFNMHLGDLPLVAIQNGIKETPDPFQLLPDAKLVKKYEQELAMLGPAPYIAVTWRSGPRGQKQRAGVARLEKFIDPLQLGAMLANTQGTIVSLQRLPYPQEAQAFNQALGRKSADYSALNNNLAGMIALLSIVDEYITVSNTNLHLREGLAKSSHVFVNRPFQDWRWQADGDRSVWYPNSKVYRQQKDKTWGNAFKQLKQVMANIAPTHSEPSPQQPTQQFNPQPDASHTNTLAVKNEIPLNKQHLAAVNEGWAVVAQNIPLAITKAREVLTQDPSNARALHLLGWAAVQDLKFDLGLSVLAQAVQLEPNNGNIWRDLIRAHVLVDKCDEAIQIAQQSLKNPNLWGKGVVYFALGTAYLDQDLDDEALEAFEQCSQLIPDHLDAPNAAGMLRLRMGDGYASMGFKLNTARTDVRKPEYYPYWVCPILKGDITGLNVLIVRSMGFGDELTYLRYLPYLIQAGARVTYWCGFKLVPLLARLPYKLTLIPDTEPMPAPANYDLAFIKNELPIAVEHLGAPEIADSLQLIVDAGKLEKWRLWLKEQVGGPYIGISWSAGVSGNVKDGFGYSRLSKKVEPVDLAKALSGVNATFISLTRNITKDDITIFEQALGRPVIDIAGITDDLDDLLCIQALLDENVGVSNTNMHLRACLGLGSKVLVSLSSRDWRWGVQGDSSTWFKDSTVYRECKTDGWGTTLVKLREDLVAKYGLAEEYAIHLHPKLDKTPVQVNKIVWVTAGEIKKGDNGYFSPLASAQERVVNVAKLLEPKGWQSVYLIESVSELMGGWHDKLPVKGDVVVFSKVFTDHAITLMHDARARGATVIVDVFNDFETQPSRELHQQKMMQAADIIVSSPKLQLKWQRLNQPIAFYYDDINDERTPQQIDQATRSWLAVLENPTTVIQPNTIINAPQTNDTHANLKVPALTKRLIWLTGGDIQNHQGALSSDLASTRYRVITPAKALEQNGWKSQIINEAESREQGQWGIEAPQPGDTLIVSKVFTQHALSLAYDAKKRGANIVVDLCDNHLKNPQRGALQKALLDMSDLIVTSTQALNEALTQLGKQADAVISDPVEFKRNEIYFSPQNVVKLLWFGHAVNLDTLAQSLPALAQLAQITPLQLNVVTTLPNGKQDLDKVTPAGLTVTYTPWSVNATEAAIAACDIVIIPTLQSDMKNAKSPNRLLEPLWAGRMVVAGPLPAYLHFADSAWVGKSLTEGIKWCLANPQEVIERIAQGQADIEKYFTAQAIGQQWNTLLSTPKKTVSPEVLSADKDAKNIAPTNSERQLITVAILSTQSPLLPSIGIRLIEPLSLLQDKIKPQLAVKIENQRMVIDDTALDKADVVIVQRNFPIDNTITLIKDLKSKGKTIIYETDDAFHLLDSKHNKSHHLECVPWINKCIELADLVTVSTPALAKQFPQANRIVCIPNKLSPTLWNQSLLDHAHKVRQSLDSKQIRIGIIAGGNHDRDIKVVAEAIQKITNIYPNIVWVGYGDAASALFSDMDSDKKLTFASNWNYRTHPSRLASLGLDIVLAPLEDTDFNACISNLKFIENGFLEVPCIMSDVAAFNDSAQHGKNGILVKNTTSAWVDAIQTLVENPSLRKSLGKSARQTVLNNYMLSHSSQWLDILNKPEVNTPVSRFKAYNPAKLLNKIGLLTNQKLQLPSVNIRLVQPLELQGLKPIMVAGQGNDVLGVDYEAIFHFDKLIVQRDFPSSQTLPLLKKLKSLGKKLVYETDDAFHLIPEHHCKAYHLANATAIFEFAQLADVITVSTEALAKEFKPYGNVKVMPNRLSPTLWNDALLNVAKQHRAKQDLKQTRIGIVGGEGHKQDLLQLEHAIQTIVKAKPNIEWVAYGDGAVELLTPLVAKGKICTFATNLDYPSHPARVSEMALDIALVPLVDDSFNQCRSNLKFLEFGFLGVPCVFSNTPSYNQTVVDGETGLLVDNSTENWVKAIQTLIDNPTLREKIGANAQKEVQTNWMLTNQNNGWQEVLDKLE